MVIKMAQIGNININDLTKMITMKVSITGYKKYNLKMYIGKLLILFGIKIMGMKSEMEFIKEVN